MANELRIDLVVNDKGEAVISQFSHNVKKNLDDVDDSAGKTSNSFLGMDESALKLAGSMLGVSASIAGVVALVKKSISAYMEQEAAEMKLAMAMKNQDDYTSQGFNLLKEYANQLQQTTVYGDDLTLSVMGNLKSYGMNNEEVKKAIQAAMDLTSAKKNEGMTIETAGQLIGKAYAGVTDGLSRYGIVIEDGMSKTEKFNAVMNLVKENFGGSAQADLKTYSGQWKNIKNEFGEIAEVIGKTLLKAIEGLQVAIGFVGSGFYTVIEKILSGLGTFLEYVDKGAAWVDKIAGRQHTDMITNLSSSLKTGAETFKLMSENAMDYSMKNVEVFKTTDRVTDAMDKLIEKEGQHQASKIKSIELTDKEKKALEDFKSLEERLKDQTIKSDSEVAGNKLNLLNYEYNKHLETYTKMHKNTLTLDEWYAAEATKIVNEQLDENDKNHKEFITKEKKIKEEQIENEIEIEKEKFDTVKEFWEDYEGYVQEEHDFEMMLIEIKYDKYKKLYGDNLSLLEWKNEKIRELNDREIEEEIEKSKKSQSIMAGMKAGYQDMMLHQMTWGQVGFDMFKATQDAMGTMFADNIKGMISGNKNFAESFKNFTDTLSNVFIEMCAKMLAEWIMMQAAMAMANILGLGAGAGGVLTGALTGGTVGAGALTGGTVGAGGEAAGGALAGVGGTAGLIALAVAIATGTYMIGKEAGGEAGGVGALLGLILGGIPGALIGGAGGKWVDEHWKDINSLSDIDDTISEGAKDAEDTISEGAKDIEDTISDFGSDIGDTFGWHKGGYIPRAHNGMFIGNLGNDERRVIVQTEEGILNRNATKKIGGKAGIDALNAGGSVGKSIIINFNIDGNLISDEQTFNQFVDKIRNKMYELDQYEY